MNAPGANEISFRRYTPSEARGLKSMIETVYASSYVEAIASGHSFDSIEAFMSRFDSYSSDPGFDLIVAFDDERAIGQTWGWPLTKDTAWWNGLDTEPEPDFTREDGRRTFALSEIMVATDWAGKGVARAMHDHLLSARPEERATLLVEPENTSARRAYLHWGWHRVGRLLPGWENAPTFDVFIKALRA